MKEMCKNRHGCNVIPHVSMFFFQMYFRVTPIQKSDQRFGAEEKSPGTRREVGGLGMEASDPLYGGEVRITHLAVLQNLTN